MADEKPIREKGADGQDSLFIVGIGASAGGLEALQQFFVRMPENSGISFVVIQHLSPDYKSLMADILGKHTAMAVLQVENGMEVKPDTVYLIPPKKNMTLKDGKLILSEIVQGTLNHPIDIFFTSLAAEEKERGIAVILSGTGTDGTSGIKAMKEHGGLVLIQNPETAKFDGMPRSAINTGLADFVLSPEGLQVIPTASKRGVTGVLSATVFAPIPPPTGRENPPDSPGLNHLQICGFFDGDEGCGERMLPSNLPCPPATGACHAPVQANREKIDFHANFIREIMRLV